MKVFIVLSALVAVALAKPGHGHFVGYRGVVAPVAYAHVVPGAPIGVDGRVVDTPEVAYAKAEHTAAHVNEKITLANEAAKSADVVPGSHFVLGGHVVDTPAVAHAKAEHAAAHINEKITLAHEAAKSYSAHSAPAVIPVYTAPLVSAYSAGPVVSAYPGYAHPAVTVW